LCGGKAHARKIFVYLFFAITFISPKGQCGKRNTRDLIEFNNANNNMLTIYEYENKQSVEELLHTPNS